MKDPKLSQSSWETTDGSIVPKSGRMSPLIQWRNRRGRRGGGGSAPETSDREIFADLPGKRGKGKGVKIEKKRRKTVKGKVEIENGR